ncbi:MAG: T9SS type A sorting domain-containing protein [Flavobacteriaceae bacterium]|nr:T9SS type A sorting domain-containing protein [Flavobacteriaceae bacterium]
MKLIFSLLFISVTAVSYGQLQQRAALTMSGNSTVITQNSKSFYISESVGQQGAIGTIYNENFTTRQGFQQPPILIKSIIQDDSALDVTIFPNPVKTSVTLAFGEELRNGIEVVVYDIQGREIKRHQLNAAPSHELDLSTLSTGAYLLKIMSENREFSAQIIKK